MRNMGGESEAACMLSRALPATGQITLWRVGGWDSLHVVPNQEPLKLAA